jgi:hypothetical protein
MKATVQELMDSINMGSYDILRRDKWLPMATFFRLKPVTRALNVIKKDFSEIQEAARERHGGQLAQIAPNQFRYVFPDADSEKAFNDEIQPVLDSVKDIPGARFVQDDFKPRPMDAGSFLSEEDLERLDWLIDDGVTPRVDPEPPVAEIQVEGENTASEAEEDAIPDAIPEAGLMSAAPDTEIVNENQ